MDDNEIKRLALKAKLARLANADEKTIGEELDKLNDKVCSELEGFPLGGVLLFWTIGLAMALSEVCPNHKNEYMGKSMRTLASILDELEGEGEEGCNCGDTNKPEN